jgi:uncharacterized protein
MPYPEIQGPSRRQGGMIVVIVILLAVFMGARTAASYVIDYQWWKEMGQIPTWISMLLYGLVPALTASVLAFVVLWWVHARAVKSAGTGLRRVPLYAKISTVALLIVGFLLASATIDSWTAIRFFGGRNLPLEATAWRDPVFAHPLSFYLFELPFYSELLRFVLGLALVSAVLYLLTSRLWQLRERFPEWAKEGTFDFQELRLGEALGGVFLRWIGAIFLLALAVRFYLDRYSMLYNDHGFLVGVDYVNQNVSLPLQWLAVAAAIAAAVFLALRQRKLALAMVAVLFLRGAVPLLVNALYVKPNEISLQRPYVERHIAATRAAYGLERRIKEVDFAAKLETKVDPARHKPLLDNVRLWDWRAFHDTVTQLQAIRPYYVFVDSDVDRYTIDGQLRQVLLTPRELDIRQVGAQAGWVNSKFVYTHGYGAVMAEANRITPDGLPVLFIQDAPLAVKTPSLKLTRPELYYGEQLHEPVFVRTKQPEFNYPSGAENVHSTYEGTGGFPVASLPVRFAAALAEGDWKILLTPMFTSESRMMVRRKVRDRLGELAGFVTWDADPYLVLTSGGRMVWMVDGYTTSQVHPYSRMVDIQGVGSVNYIRNSVKATVDAYDGTARLYVFDPTDPIVQAYRRIFPHLLVPASEMPADLRAHARYPETLFRVQAEIYRTFHMLDPESFYNKEDLWDIARTTTGQEAQAKSMTPTYIVGTVPGSEKPEFLLILPFTPRSKDNLIGMMVARCDGENLGEMLILKLSKQALIYGPMQIEAKISQDQDISKDLTLWNQQGSQVLRGQMLVLPVEDTFIYIQPIYIQASQARMPQLKKIALGMGNTVIYKDTYEQAIAELAGVKVLTLAGTVLKASAPAAASAPGAGPDPRIESVRKHFRRYRDLVSQGKWAEAGKELEAAEGELGR